MRATAARALEDVARQAGALASQRKCDRGTRLELGERALAPCIEGDRLQFRGLAQGDHRYGIERSHARPHGARRERIGATVGERDVCRPEALCAAQQRAEIARIGDAVQVQSDRARGRPRGERRQVVGAQHADGAARGRERRERRHHTRGTTQHLRTRRRQLLGDAIAAEIVVDERLDGRDAGRERRTQRVLALIDEEAGAPPLLGLAERTRRLHARIRAAGDHLLRERGLGALGERCEGLRLVHREIGQHLAVDRHLGALEPVDHLAVARARACAPPR